MGMDLIPLRKDKQQYWLHYNWCGWSTLIDFLRKLGVDTDEFSGWNDGEVISGNTCKEVSKTLEDHFDEFTEEFSDGGETDEETSKFCKHHIDHWKKCGGFRQY